MSASRSGQKLKSSGSGRAAGPSMALLSKTIGTRGMLSSGCIGGGTDGDNGFGRSGWLPLDVNDDEEEE